MSFEKIISAASLRRQRRNLAAWLAEWRLRQALEGEYPDRPARPRDVIASKIAEPAAGQIRLLCPDDAVTARRPLYLLVLQAMPCGHWLAAPFGLMAAPAIPGEWLTGLRALPVRVLCAWNARSITSDRLRRSWQTAKLDPRRLRMARHLIVNCFAGIPAMRAILPPGTDRNESATAGLGPPLRHPLDPRHEYLLAESERLDSIGDPLGALNGDFCWLAKTVPAAAAKRLDYKPAAEINLLQAAEKRGHYDSSTKRPFDKPKRCKDRRSRNNGESGGKSSLEIG